MLKYFIFVSQLKKSVLCDVRKHFPFLASIDDFWENRCTYPLRFPLSIFCLRRIVMFSFDCNPNFYLHPSNLFIKSHSVGDLHSFFFLNRLPSTSLNPINYQLSDFKNWSDFSQLFVFLLQLLIVFVVYLEILNDGWTFLLITTRFVGITIRSRGRNEIWLDLEVVNNNGWFH